MRNNKKDTWLGYIQALSLKEYKSDFLQVEDVEKILSVNQQFNRFFFHSVPLVYALDYTTGKYITMSKSARAVLGFSPADFMEGGIGFTIDQYHAEDLKIYNEKIFPDRLHMLKNIPQKEHSKHIFSYNFRFKQKNGEYASLLQRNCFIRSDENGIPLVSFGMVLNISHFRKDNPVIQVVEKINDDNDVLATEVLNKSVYYLHEEDRLFSKREKEILLWTADGLTSKEIADKIFLSNHTIINHRKNMLLKSGTKNTSELISFALRNGII